MLRTILIVLLFAFLFLVVAFGVLMGGAVLAGAMDDPTGARVLMWIANSCLILIVIDAVLLVGALAIHVLLHDQENGRGVD
jgi:hypothetical protein